MVCAGLLSRRGRSELYRLKSSSSTLQNGEGRVEYCEVRAEFLQLLLKISAT